MGGLQCSGRPTLCHSVDCAPRQLRGMRRGLLTQSPAGIRCWWQGPLFGYFRVASAYDNIHDLFESLSTSSQALQQLIGLHRTGLLFWTVTSALP